MSDYFEYLEGYRDAQAYDVEEGDHDEDYPLIAQLARELGGPLLDLACGTGTMAIRMAEQWKPCSSTMDSRSAHVTGIGSKSL